MTQEDVCKFNKFGFCKFGNTCFKKHDNRKCEKKDCNIWKCSQRHPKMCRYFSEFKMCKFGDFCRFSHDPFANDKNIKEIDEIKEKIRCLKQVIEEKDTEINKIMVMEE